MVHGWSVVELSEAGATSNEGFLLPSIDRRRGKLVSGTRWRRRLRCTSLITSHRRLLRRRLRRGRVSIPRSLSCPVQFGQLAGHSARQLRPPNCSVVSEWRRRRARTHCPATVSRGVCAHESFTTDGRSATSATACPAPIIRS